MIHMSAIKLTEEQLQELKQGSLVAECNGRHEGKIISFEEHLKAMEALEDEFDLAIARDCLARREATGEKGVSHQELLKRFGIDE